MVCSRRAFLRRVGAGALAATAVLHATGRGAAPQLAETRPLMVNEEVPLASERPFWVLYEKQLNSQGIPKWEPPEP